MALELKRDTLDGLDENVQALYVEKDGKFTLDVNGMEDVSGLKSALDAERTSARTSKKALSDMKVEFNGIDPVKFRAMMARTADDAEAKLIADGKIDEVIKNRMALMTADSQKKHDADSATIDMFSKNTLERDVMVACNNLGGMHKGGIADAVLRAQSVFTVDRETGKTVQLGSDGVPVLGKDGKTPLGPDEWIESMKDVCPHWFVDGNTGSGADGQGKEKNGKTMTRGDFNALDAVGKGKFIKDGGVVVN